MFHLCPSYFILEFPARKLPPVFEFPIASLGGENRVSPADDGGNYFDGFHWDMLWLLLEQDFPIAAVVRADMNDNLSLLQGCQMIFYGVFRFTN